jgi:hypothetical protein
VQQRDPVMLVVEGQERQGSVLVDHVGVEDGAVPVAHRLVVGGLEDVMGELGRGHVDLLRHSGVLWVTA